MPQITGHGWELLVTRLGIQATSGLVRTYGSYQVFIDNNPVPALAGHICERTGPGDNSSHGVEAHTRITQGRYPLSTQFGTKYVSTGFSDGVEHPLPGFLLMSTGHRSAILVHPGHPPNLFLSSIGCFNPTAPLTANQIMNFTESRARVIALIDSLRMHDPDAFDSETNTPIENAAMVVDGEPMGPVPVGAVA